MSRTYRVSVKGAVHRTVHVEDGVSTILEVLPVLPKERMGALLADELTKRGFKRENDSHVLVREDDGVTVSVDSLTGELKVSANDSQEINDEKTYEVGVEEEVLKAGTERAQNHIDRVADAEAASIEAEVRRQVTEKLERRLEPVRRELDQVLNTVTAEALKEKARKIGEIEEMSENSVTGELTIKVKL